MQIARSIQSASPEIFAPLADFFDIDIDKRLNTPAYREGLYYEGYL